MSRVYNFSPGPAQLPEEVLRQVQDELLDWHGTGMSVMELPHRSQTFEAIAATAEQDLRDLLSIPAHYKVLFMHGGGRSQFAMVPMNFASQSAAMAYVETGTWSQLAIAEAQLYGNVQLAASGAANQFTDIPPEAEWQFPDDAAYLHYTDNETIHGVEFATPPDSRGLPLITDMSSNLLSRPLDINQFGLIYACAQKNLGPAGITIGILHEDLLQREPFAFTPSMYRYSNYAENASLYNTPATFAWYVVGLVFQWVKRQGGVAKMAELNQRKSAKLYQAIDQSDFFHNPVSLQYRSRMNIPFTLADATLDQKFLQEAEKVGLTHLKGHRLAGGMRASIYNAMPESGIDSLITFMRDFERRYA